MRKGVCPNECMNDWGKFNNTSFPEKEDVCSHLNIEDITDADYPQAQWLCKYFETKDLGECHYLYVQGNTLMLADKFENFRNIFLEIYDLDPTKFLSSLELAWEAALKKLK